jgi:RNA polymerase sigma factor (sigma-70 family)
MPALTAQLARYISLANTQRSDGELLAGFLNHSDEANFAELIRRHGPMVWSTCRRNLPDFADAEDAFQTVFLVLVQRGNRLFSSQSIGPWLHRVAVWTTRNVRRRNARQLARREMLTEQISARGGNVDLSLDIDAALLSLPEKVRSSIVLCHILGYSRADAAAQLGCAERTLSSWISRGLAQLRERLPGLDPAKALSVGAVAVPLGLADTVVKAAIASRTAALAASVLSPNVSQLVEGVIRMFWVKKATAATVALFTMFAFGVGIGVSTHQLAPAKGDERTVVQKDTTALVEKDIDNTITELENQLAQTATTLAWAEGKIQLFEEQSARKENSDVQNKQYREAIALMKKDAETLTSKLADLRSTLKSAQEKKALKALEKVQAQQQKTQSPPAKDPDKQLNELEKRLMKLQVEAEAAQVEHALKTEAQKRAIQELNVLITKLQIERARRQEDTTHDLSAAVKDLNAAVESARAKSKGGYLELHLEATKRLNSWLDSDGKKENLPSIPYHVNEVGPDGKVVGSVYFTNADVLGRYLARTLKDNSGPKELRIVSRADATAEQLKLVIEVCKAAGFQDIVVAKAGAADKLADADEAKKRSERERYAHELQRAYEAEREATAKIEIERQKALLQALERKQVELQKLLEQKEVEIRKLKDPNKQQNPLSDQKQKEKQIQQDIQKALEQKLAELERLKEKESEIRKLKDPNMVPNDPQLTDLLKLLEQKEAEIRKLKEANRLPKKDEPAGPIRP